MIFCQKPECNFRKCLPGMNDVVTGRVQKTLRRGLNPQKYMVTFDSYNPLKATGDETFERGFLRNKISLRLHKQSLGAVL